ASRPYWEALVRHADETQPDVANDKLAALMAACAVDISSASAQIKESLAELNAQATPTTQPSARSHLLAALLIAHDLTREKPIRATSVERLLDLLLLLKNQSTEPQSPPLTGWERNQNDAITASLDRYVAALAAEQQTAVLPKLEKVKAGAGVSLRLAQIRREISDRHFAPARELLSKTQSDFAQDQRVQQQVATLRLWIDTGDPLSDFAQLLPRVARALLTPSPTDPEAPLSESLLSRLKALGAQSSELDSAIDLFTQLRADAKSPTAEFDLALARLVNERLAASLRASKSPATLASDATLLLSLPSQTTNDSAMLPAPLVAAAAIEAQLSSGKAAADEAHGKELLARCKQPLTSQEQAAWPWATNYPEWVLLAVAARDGQPLSDDAIRAIYTRLPDDSMLKTPSRRGQSAQLIWNSFAKDALPNDLQIPWTNQPDYLTKMVANLTIARALATDSALSTAEQARIAAALAIVDYYASLANKEPLAKSLAMAETALSKAEFRAALVGNESAPGMLQHLLYVRGRASLATIGTVPVAEQDRERLVRQAAEVVEASFDFIGFQRATDSEVQDAADLDLYFAVVQPALRIAGQNPPENLQPSLAILHASQARIVERSNGVRGKLLREGGIKVEGLFNLRRDSYAQAAQWEKRPDIIVRNCLHHAAAMLDWHGSRAVEVRQLLPGIIARAKSANPDAHGTHYLQGMEHLFLSRDEGLDLCNIAKSAAKQRAELDLAEQSLQKALSSPSLTKAENAEYRPRYYVGLSAVNLERAFIRATVDEKVPILLQAREQAVAAIAAASDHPLKLFLDQAYIAEGNAYEDLALHCDRKQHFNDSEQSFKNGQAAAGAGWLQSEASFHLGRCQLRNALRTIQRQESEKLVAKLDEAEASLLDARDNLPKLEKPHLLGYAIEANIHLAGVYMELAEFHAGRKDGPRAAAFIVKADQAYQDAVSGAAEHAPAAWGDYQATWIRRAAKRLRSQRLQDAPEATETRKLVDRLATELLEVATATQPAATRPITADQRALAVQALMDAQESKNSTPLLTELRGGRIPRNLTAAQVAEIKTVLEAKQRVLAAKLAVFGNSTCDDMTMAALGLLFDLHQQCSRLPQFTGVRGYCSDTVNKVADRLQPDDWKQRYAKSMAVGFRGLASADPLLIGLTRDQRKAKTAEFKIAIANLLQATNDLSKLAGQNAELVDKGLIDEGKSTAAFRLTLAELVLEINDFIPPPARDAATKQLATQAKSLLQDSLGRPALVKHQKVVENALDQLDSFLE
ncbi:MAG TPA: hypothetical protein VL096_12850, partial [Pirellulaceae bacterium]|nr:hypothetical protein [Pirellulaceae bacterium]